MGNVIYIAGPIAGDPGYRAKFYEAEARLRTWGWTVLNPACLPEGLKQADYMPICLAMVNAADAVLYLDREAKSKGAFVELKFAEYQGKWTFHSLGEAEDHAIIYGFLKDDGTDGTGAEAEADAPRPKRCMTLLDNLLRCNDKELMDALPYIRIKDKQPSLAELKEYLIMQGLCRRERKKRESQGDGEHDRG